jgi:hypothetical protein
MKIVKVPGAGEELLFFGSRDVLRAKTRSLRLEGLADNIAIANVLLCGYPNARSNSWAALNQTLGFQTLHGFGDGQEAHVEPIGQLPS